MAKRRRNEPAKMTDIARMAGVSVSTVSRALAGSKLVEKSQRQEILRLAQESGYVVNSTARNLRLQRSQILSVAVPPPGNEAGRPPADPFVAEMLGYVADEITQRGYGVFLQKVLPPTGDWLSQLIGSNRSDGILVIGLRAEYKALEAAAERYLPLVVWGENRDKKVYCSVSTDNVAGARLATEHLLETGRRQIVFFGETSTPEIRLRYEGYKTALACGPREAAGPRNVPAHLTADTAYEAMCSFIDSGASFDAVVATSDVIAMSAIRALTTAGKTVPGDVAVVGYDDLSMASHFNPPLSSVRQDLPRGARIMVDLLFRRMNGEKTPSATMPAELVVRESSVAAVDHSKKKGRAGMVC